MGASKPGKRLTRRQPPGEGHHVNNGQSTPPSPSPQDKALGDLAAQFDTLIDQFTALSQSLAGIQNWQRAAGREICKIQKYLDPDTAVDEISLELSEEQESRRLELHDIPRLRKRLQKRAGIAEQPDPEAEDGYTQVVDLRNNIISTELLRNDRYLSESDDPN